MNSFRRIEDKTFANDFLTRHFKKNVNKVTFFKSEKRKIRILEHCLSSVDNELGWVTVDGCGWVG